MLQVNWIIDISQSAYSQFRLLTQHFEDNSGFDCGTVEDNHDEGKSSQFLLMEVTDGQRKLRAITIGDIDGLSLKSTPGMKIYLFADVLCRRNILTLTPLNTQVLGGDVDALLDINTSVHIIVRRLNIDESKLQRTERVEKSVMDADREPEKKEIMEIEEEADMPRVAKNDIEGNQSGGSNLNKQIIEDVDIKLGKSEETSVECGTKTIAIGDCARDEVPMDTTILMTRPECVKNMTNEVAKATVVPVMPTVRKTVEREECERPSILKLQSGITLKIVPHKGPQLEDEIVKEKWNGAKEDRSNQSTGWNKRTLDEATLKEMDLKLKKTTKKNKGPPMGMRTITSYYAPVRRLRESESGKLEPSYNSLSVKADSSLKMETGNIESRPLSFQAVFNENSNGPCVNKDVDPHPRRQVPAVEGLSHCRQAPELENSGQRFFDQIPRLECVSRPTCGQMRGVEGADRLTFDKISELKCSTHPSCHQLPVLGDSNRHDCRQEQLLENIGSLADRRLEGFSERGANISQIFQKASNLHSTLPFPASCEQPAGRISRGSFLEKLDKMYKKKADAAHETNTGRQATTSENMPRSNTLPSSSIGLPWQRKEHEHSTMPISSKEIRKDSYANTLWNAIRNPTSEKIYSVEHNDSGIIPPIWDSKRGDISPTSRLALFYG
uniref:RecQ-mediated genome instability protein 1 n=1 Tax=Ascaris lumbricoides TaxID=6252 RepID=A0A0M3I8D9_ASCLU